MPKNEALVHVKALKTFQLLIRCFMIIRGFYSAWTIILWQLVNDRLLNNNYSNKTIGPIGVLD